MRILIVDGGGRGHALYRAAVKSPLVTQSIVAPGTGGIPTDNRANIETNEIEKLVTFAKGMNAEMVIAADDASVTGGLVDACEEKGIRAFGTHAACAALEGSKIFGKKFCSENAIPTTRYRVFGKDRFGRVMRKAYDEWGTPPVVKMDGLARGKGVILPATFEEARIVARHLFDARPNELILIEEFQEGWEFTSMWICDGEHAFPLDSVVDHKRLSNERGAPNTGGMGGYSPGPRVTGALMEEIETKIVRRTLSGMQKRGTPYRGILNLNLMITKTGPKLLEYNCRYGDSEIQALMPRFTSDPIELMLASTTFGGLLKVQKPIFANAVSVCVNAVVRGYPECPEVGDEIFGITEASEACTLYHAGTKHENAKYFTAGGRVLNFVGTGNTLAEARNRAYTGARMVSYKGMRVREDIACTM